MNFQSLKKSFSEMRGQSAAISYANAGLVVMLGVSLWGNFQKDTVVINNLNESCQESEISSSSMNEANHRRLGFYLAGMLGNITPASASYVESAVAPFASPEIYHKVNDLIAYQIASLVEEEVTMKFSAERAFVEDGKTFVTGKGSMQGMTGKADKYVRTYEFIFDVQNYTPTFDYIDVYDDVPHDSEWKQKNRKKLEADK